MELTIDPKTDALIIVDPQNDFCPDGALAVAGGDAIMRPINELSLLFDMIVLTQDWHPKGHKSFASSQYLEPFSTIEMPYGEQTLWPDHCVQGTRGADFHPFLAEAVERAKLIIRKGFNPDVDSYSAFRENDRSQTGLEGYLKERGIKRIFLVGLAYDFCVAYSALDGAEAGFEAIIVEDLTRAIAMPVSEGITTVNVMEERFLKAGVRIIKSNRL